jgi:peptidyl-prolyl cis-trans isomerase SurA
MSKKNQTLVIAFLLTLTSFSQTNDPVVLTIDNESYTISEFNYIYTKNQKVEEGKKDTLYRPSSLDNYMELFINYKLKVGEAKKLGYDTIPRLKNELRQYRSQLSQPYMIDKEKNEALVKEAYDRTKNEIRASHILIRLNPEATPEDTLKAYNIVIAVRNRIVENGEDFSTVAKSKKGSQDPSVAFNGGDLGYFTALQMVYPFEDAAFKTNIGDVSMPVRTQFGYHIIKVTDKRESKGKIVTSHIMLMSNDKMTGEEQEKAQTEINEIYNLLENGDKFENLAMKFSDDQSSNAKGGLLPAFGAGSKQRMVPIFEETAFALENDEDYSKPFLTNYGWHIVKRVNISPIASYEEMYKELKLKVERDVRAQKTKEAFINSLKTEYNFSENKETLIALNPILNETIMQGRWKKIEKFANSDETLFSFADVKITLNDFAEYLLATQMREKPKEFSNYINSKYNAFVSSEVTKYEDTQLETKYPAFKKLMQEYQDGILIFEIMQNEIWTKASKDTVGLANYYNTHKDEFLFPLRYKGTMYTCMDKKISKRVLELLKANNYTPSQINDSINGNSTLNLKTKISTFNSLTTPEIKTKKGKIRTFEIGLNKKYKYNSAYYIFDIDEVLQPSQRKFSEAKGLVTAAYQNKIQKDWISSLRNKSKIIINTEILYTAKKYQ